MRQTAPVALVALITVTSSLHAESVRTDNRRGKATLHYRITSGDGLLSPGKLTIRGIDGTRDPNLGPRFGQRAGDAVASFHRVYSATGHGQLSLPAGSYDITVSRGIEWTISRHRVTVGPDGAEIIARLDHAVDTVGWLSSDLHVHASRSTDSLVPMRSRAVQMIADGVELIVATDHNTISDYQPSIDALGARHLITGLRGFELTTKRWGHLGGFPLPAELAWKPRGKVLMRGGSGERYIANIRAAAPESIIIAYHPHSRSSSYLRDGGYHPRRDRARPGFSWDFDAIEILNGYNKWNFGRAIGRNLSAWFAMLDHGHLVAAVAGSDTHQLRAAGGQGGYPRTYVRVDDDRPDAVTEADVVRGLKRRRAILTTGPFVDATVGRYGIGDLAPAPGGRAVLDVRVQAAPWIKVDRLTLIVNGVVRERIPIPASTEVVRLRIRRELTVARDGYVVLRVDGRPGGLEPVAGAADHPLPVFALTNPIFLDVDGNGRFDAPRPHGHRD